MLAAFSISLATCTSNVFDCNVRLRTCDWLGAHSPIHFQCLLQVRGPGVLDCITDCILCHLSAAWKHMTERHGRVWPRRQLNSMFILKVHLISQACFPCITWPFLELLDSLIIGPLSCSADCILQSAIAPGDLGDCCQIPDIALCQGQRAQSLCPADTKLSIDLDPCRHAANLVLFEFLGSPAGDLPRDQPERQPQCLASLLGNMTNSSEAS